MNKNEMEQSSKKFKEDLRKKFDKDVRNCLELLNKNKYV